MKLSLLNSIFCASIIVFAAGCGKENKSGGGKRNGYGYPYGNPYTYPPVQTTQGKANLDAWYHSNVEAPSNYYGTTRIEKRVKHTYSSATCNTSTALGFIDIEICKGGGYTITNLPDRSVFVVQSANKSAYPKLASVFNAGQGTLLSVIETSSPVSAYGRLYVVTYAKPNGHSVQYKVDTGLNSAFNPVEIYDSETRMGEIVTNPQNLR